MIYQLLIILIQMTTPMMSKAQVPPEKSITKNGLTVSWSYTTDRIFFSIEAPTNGWVAIGFNQKEELSDTYLIMGSIVQNNVQVVEHYVLEPGNYKPITDLGASSKVTEISGTETKGKTKILFSVPIRSQNKFRKNLRPESVYSLLIAYSMEDDFMHHSRMRTSLKIQL